MKATTTQRILLLTWMALLLLSFAAARVGKLSVDQEASTKAMRQSTEEFVLSDGRGQIFDYSFHRMTGAEKQYVALAYRDSDYDALFAATAAEDKPALYSGTQGNVPFLVRLYSRPDALLQNVFCVENRYRAVPLAVHTLGYRNSDGIGMAGMERFFDEYLDGGASTLLVRCATNAFGAASGKPQLSVVQGSGNAIRLSLDTTLQRICEDVAAQELEQGAIVMMECKTGRIKASVSMPQYDPENVQKSIDAQDTALVNRVVSSYNVGSVYKPLIAALALEKGIDPDAQYECTGSIEVDGHTYHCARLSGHGKVDMAEALENSCNCYFIWLGQQLGGQSIRDFSYLCGLGQATQLGGGYCAGEGNLPTEQEIQSSGELANLCFGQGRLTATPIQMAAAFNIFANGGVYLSPTLVEGKINSYTMQVTENFYAPTQLQVISPENAEKIRELLEGVVKYGLGRSAIIAECSLAGKTGTAQTGRYRTDENGVKHEIYESWFAGFYPAENAEYTIVVMMDSTDITGESVAPVFSKVCRALYYLENRD